jgi:hypothetical protein
VLSNLSFTAKFDIHKTPDFERSQGFCGFWRLDFMHGGISEGASEIDVGRWIGVWEAMLESHMVWGLS